MPLRAFSLMKLLIVISSFHDNIQSPPNYETISYVELQVTADETMCAKSNSVQGLSNRARGAELRNTCHHLHRKYKIGKLCLADLSFEFWASRPNW